MSNLKLTKHYAEFCNECSFFYCKDPNFYGQGWSGEERFIITSELSEEQMLLKYPEMAEQLSPYIFLSAEYGDVFLESQRNNDKFKKRQECTASLADIDKISVHAKSSSAEGIEAVERKLLIEEALSLCTPKERDRIVKFYYEGIPKTHIDKCAVRWSVTESINAGIKKIRKNFE